MGRRRSEATIFLALLWRIAPPRPSMESESCAGERTAAERIAPEVLCLRTDDDAAAHSASEQIQKEDADTNARGASSTPTVSPGVHLEHGQRRRVQLSADEITFAVGILTSALDKIHLASLHDTDGAVQDVTASSSPSPREEHLLLASAAMRQRSTLESRFTALVRARHALGSTPNKTKQRENQEELQHVTASLSAVTAALERSLNTPQNTTASSSPTPTARVTLVLRNIVRRVSSPSPIGESEDIGSLAIDALRQFVQCETAVAQLGDDAAARAREKKAVGAVKTLREALLDARVSHETWMTAKRLANSELEALTRQSNTSAGVALGFKAGDLIAARRCALTLTDHMLDAIRADIASVASTLQRENIGTSVARRHVSVNNVYIRR